MQKSMHRGSIRIVNNQLKHLLKINGMWSLQRQFEIYFQNTLKNLSYEIEKKFQTEM